MSSHYYLSASSSGDYVTSYWPDGAVRVDSVAYTHASTFEVHEVATGEWQLRAVKNNNFLSAENGGGQECVANRPTASGWETFRVAHVSDGQVQLQSFDNHWITVGDVASCSQLLATATSAAAAETFTVVKVPQHRAVNLGSWFVPEKW